VRETARAKQAWLDYLAMGGGRSFEKLLEMYRTSPKPGPTRHLRSLKSWSATFGWQVRLADVAEEERQAIVAQGIAARQNRVDAYGDRWERMRQVIAERATDRELADIPGGKTGLLVRTFKGVGGAIAEEFAVDTGLLREMREIEKQAAQDLGQWVEKQESSGEQRITVDYVNDWRPGAERKANPSALPPSGSDDGPDGGEAV
jgi:hypothetical protein